MENNISQKDTDFFDKVDNDMNLTLLEKGKLTFLKKQEEDKDNQAVTDDKIFKDMIELANKRFGGEFSWKPSRLEDFYLITNLESRIVLGSLSHGKNLWYIKKCKECKELINSVEVYLHDLPLVHDGTIKFRHNCKDKQSSPEDTLLTALEEYVVDIVESYQQ